MAAEYLPGAMQDVAAQLPHSTNRDEQFLHRLQGPADGLFNDARVQATLPSGNFSVEALHETHVDYMPVRRDVGYGDQVQIEVGGKNNSLLCGLELIMEWPELTTATAGGEQWGDFLGHRAIGLETDSQPLIIRHSQLRTLRGPRGRCL